MSGTDITIAVGLISFCGISATLLGLITSSKKRAHIFQRVIDIVCTVTAILFLLSTIFSIIAIILANQNIIPWVLGISIMGTGLLLLLVFGIFIGSIAIMYSDFIREQEDIDKAAHTPTSQIRGFVPD